MDPSQEFEICLPGKIRFGVGEFQRVGRYAAGFGRRALIVTNSRHALVEQLCALLQVAEIHSLVFYLDCEPRVEDVDRGVEAARAEGCTLVLALGGGSALDAAKAIAGLHTNGGTALEYLEVVGRGKPLTQPAAPWIAIPVTAGTGAEATRNAVLAYPQKQYKASLRSEYLLPRLALVDPALGLEVRPEVTARCGMDALTQLVEAFTARRAQPFTDALAQEGLRHAARSLRRVYHQGSDLGARADMAFAALASGICLANAGLGAVHGFAAALGAQFPAPHGAVCAALLPHVLAANLAALRVAPPETAAQAAETIRRYAVVGRILTGEERLRETEAADAAAGVAGELAREFAIPGLRAFGVTPAHAPEVAAKAKQASSMKGNPVALSDAALENILRAAL